MDLTATTLHLAGVDVPDHMHSRPFLGENRTPPRTQLHLIRDRMDERYDLVRGVRTARFLYLRNYESYRPYGASTQLYGTRAYNAGAASAAS